MAAHRRLVPLEFLNVHMIRTVAAAIIATIASAAFASSASAGLLTASAESCDDGPITQPFKLLGDGANYKLLPGGSFEAGTAA